MSVQLLIAMCAGASLVFGISGALIGANVGAKIALAKIEVWIQIRGGDIEALKQDCANYREDLLVHDVEHSIVFDKLGLKRVRRQELRGS